MESRVSRSIPKSPARIAYENCQLMAPRYLLANQDQGFLTIENSTYVSPELRFGEAARIVDEMLITATLTRMDEGRRELLEESVAFGLQSGLGEEEILKTADRFSWSAGDEEQFVKGLLTITSLKTAQSLHWKNMSEGGEGILDDFDAMVESVSDAIIDGYITFENFDLKERKSEQARYASDSNKIQFDLPKSTFNLPELSLALIHECRHAYQDIMKVTMTREKVEEEAYTASARFVFLAGRVHDDVQFGEIYEMMPADQHDEDKKRLGDLVNSWLGTLNQRRVDVRGPYATWRENTIMGMYGINTSHDEDLFHQWYGVSTFIDRDLDPFQLITEEWGKAISAIPCTELSEYRDSTKLQKIRNKMHESCEPQDIWVGDEGDECLSATDIYVKFFNFILGVYALRAPACDVHNKFIRLFQKNAPVYYTTDTDFIIDNVLARQPSYFDGL